MYSYSKINWFFCSPKLVIALQKAVLLAYLLNLIEQKAKSTVLLIVKILVNMYSINDCALRLSNEFVQPLANCLPCRYYFRTHTYTLNNIGSFFIERNNSENRSIIRNEQGL